MSAAVAVAGIAVVAVAVVALLLLLLFLLCEEKRRGRKQMGKRQARDGLT
jgi:O-antigen/teichoic acid export membrane protein